MSAAIVPPTFLTFIDTATTGEDYEGRGGSRQLDDEFPDIAREYQRIFNVHTVAPNVGPASALEAVTQLFGVDIGEPYATDFESDDHAICVNMVADQGEDCCHWIVRATYAPLNDPLTLPLEIEEQYQQDKIRTDRTAPVPGFPTGKAIVNSAGDPPLEGVEKDDSRPLLILTRNESTSDSPAGFYRDKLNADVFRGYPPRCVKVNQVRTQRLWSPRVSTSDGYYYRRTYEFAINEKTWDQEILDQGLRELDYSDSTKKNHILGSDKLPVTEPWPLDGMGHKALVKAGENFEGIYLAFPVYEEADYAALDLEGVV